MYFEDGRRDKEEEKPSSWEKETIRNLTKYLLWELSNLLIINFNFKMNMSVVVLKQEQQEENQDQLSLIIFTLFDNLNDKNKLKLQSILID